MLDACRDLMRPLGAPAFSAPTQPGHSHSINVAPASRSGRSCVQSRAKKPLALLCLRLRAALHSGCAVRRPSLLSLPPRPPEAGAPLACLAQSRRLRGVLLCEAGRCAGVCRAVRWRALAGGCSRPVRSIARRALAIVTGQFPLRREPDARLGVGPLRAVRERPCAPRLPCRPIQRPWRGSRGEEVFRWCGPYCVILGRVRPPWRNQRQTDAGAFVLRNSRLEVLASKSKAPASCPARLCVRGTVK